MGGGGGKQGRGGEGMSNVFLEEPRFGLRVYKSAGRTV